MTDVEFNFLAPAFECAWKVHCKVCECDVSKRSILMHLRTAHQDIAEDECKKFYIIKDMNDVKHGKDLNVWSTFHTNWEIKKCLVDGRDAANVSEPMEVEGFQNGHMNPYPYSQDSCPRPKAPRPEP